MKTINITMSREHLDQAVQSHIQSLGYAREDGARYHVDSIDLSKDGLVELKGHTSFEKEPARV